MNPVDYLRISLVDRCNFRCQYCMPEGADIQYVLQQNLLTPEELLTLLREVFIPVGFTRFRLTGGEPLVYPGVVEIVRAIAQFPETQDLSMTTNGFLLSKLAQDLYDSGLRRVNISLIHLTRTCLTKLLATGDDLAGNKFGMGFKLPTRLGLIP